MPQIIPYIPQRITVHLGAPSSDAANVTVNFADYVKNVASSEIYPTWEEAALRANILAIVFFALASGAWLSDLSGTGSSMGAISPFRSVRRMARAVPSVAVTAMATFSRGNRAVLV